MKNGRFEVSSKGRVRNLRTGRIMKSRANADGYMIYTLHLGQQGGKKIQLTISEHRLAALAFLPNPMNFNSVDHIWEDKGHNCICALQWMPGGENAAKSHTKGNSFTFRNPAGELVTFSNMKKHCREHGLNVGCMYSLRAGKIRWHKGWTRYECPEIRLVSDGS